MTRSPAAAHGGTRARVRVPAKVNLFLGVGGLRPDGYHEVTTVLQSIGLHDTVAVDLLCDGPVPAECPDAVALTFRHDGTHGVPHDGENLVMRAARVLLDRLGIEEVPADDADDDVPVLRIDLDKDIPVAAGMAGGSADAAGALIACNALLACRLDRHSLRELAAELGSDVPFCVAGGTALATGTGTRTADVLSRGQFHWVLGVSDAHLSTPDVYKAWDGLQHGYHGRVSPVLHAVGNGDAVMLGDVLHNDLQAAAFTLQPGLADDVDAFLVDGALGAMVSGSGPTVMALASDAEHAHHLAHLAADRFARVEVAASPVGGPQLRIG